MVDMEAYLNLVSDPYVVFLALSFSPPRRILSFLCRKIFLLDIHHHLKKKNFGFEFCVGFRLLFDHLGRESESFCAHKMPKLVFLSASSMKVSRKKGGQFLFQREWSRTSTLQ